MTNPISIYCDESCHLENDGLGLMVLGGIWCEKKQVRKAFLDIRSIKRHHGLSENFEIKWTKVSPGKLAFYRELVSYFFENESLHFRGLIALRKNQLVHEAFEQDHNTWYYKMYFQMLKILLSSEKTYEIYLDQKDTRSWQKVPKLQEILSNSLKDWERKVIKRIQVVNSREVEVLQLADLFIGALSYCNRKHSTSPAKNQLIEDIEKLGKHSLSKSTYLSSQKTNWFCWEPKSDYRA